MHSKTTNIAIASENKFYKISRIFDFIIKLYAKLIFINKKIFSYVPKEEF